MDKIEQLKLELKPLLNELAFTLAGACQLNDLKEGIYYKAKLGEWEFNVSFLKKGQPSQEAKPIESVGYDAEHVNSTVIYNEPQK